MDFFVFDFGRFVFIYAPRGRSFAMMSQSTVAIKSNMNPEGMLYPVPGIAPTSKKAISESSTPDWPRTARLAIANDARISVFFMRPLKSIFQKNIAPSSKRCKDKRNVLYMWVEIRGRFVV